MSEEQRREAFALAALTGLLGRPSSIHLSTKEAAELAVTYADATIAALDNHTESGYSLVRAALADFAQHGTRHDVTPTCTILPPPQGENAPMRYGPPRTNGWEGYVKEMDDYVRRTAMNVLAAAEVKP